MKAMPALRVATLLACLAAAGCVSTAEEPSKVSESDAARYNTQLGVSYLRRGDLEAARDKLEKAVKQDPRFPAAHAALGILYERTGDLARAAEHLERATRLAPDDPNMLNNYGGFLCRRGDRIEGLKYIEAAAKNAYYRTPETALTNAGVCARGIPDPGRAEGYFRQALARNPGFPDALLQLADLKLEQGEPLQARAFLQRYESVGPVTAASLSLGARTERALGNLDAATGYERRLRAQFPGSPEAGGLNGG